jgi:hypothetical protein
MNVRRTCVTILLTGALLAVGAIGLLGLQYIARQKEGPMAPTDPPELRELIEGAMNGLQAANELHDAAWHLGEADWNLDQDEGTITFQTPDGITATAPVQIIGTYNTKDGTWLWAWDNTSIRPPLAESARRLRQFGQERGFRRLTTRKLQCSEQDCWEFAALAMRVCGESGAYRGPAGNVRVFATFGEVKLSKTE